MSPMSALPRIPTVQHRRLVLLGGHEREMRDEMALAWNAESLVAKQPLPVAILNLVARKNAYVVAEHYHDAPNPSSIDE